MKNRAIKFIKQNKFVLGVITFVFLGVLLISKIGSSYALDSKIYTRKQMQEMVVSTALSLYYNNYFADYGQKTLDYLDVEGNYFNSGNTFWRDLNISPEDVGFSKYYHIDCSAYSFLVYKNTIGYDMSEYNIVNRYQLFYQQNGDYPLTRVSYYEGDERLDYYRDAYQRFGFGWNSKFMSNVARKISGNCPESSANCTTGLNNNEGKPFIYNNLDNSKDNELAYYYAANGERSKAKVIAAYDNIKSELQPGDIIRFYRYVESTDSTTGHVMLYIGDDAATSTNGESGFTDMLLHSTGNDYNNSKTSKLNKLRKGSTIMSDSASTYVNNRFEKAFDNGYIVDFSVFRPLNTVCTDDQTCKINNNDFNVELSETQLKNNEARVALKKNQVQQYMRIDKKYYDDFENDSNDLYTKNILGDYSSVNTGDVVTYKLRVRNKLDNIKTTGLTITANIPEGAEYVEGSCTEGCSFAENKLTWSDVEIDGENVNKDILFKVRVVADGELIFDGYNIKTPANGEIESKELQLNPKVLNVYPTQNGINRKMLIEKVNMFKELVDEGKITYVNSGDHETNTTDLETLVDATEPIAVSGLGFVKMMYFNAFGFDLDSIEGNEDIITTANIRNSIFTSVEYPERNNMLAQVDDDYPLYTGDTETKVFARKLEEDTYDLEGAQQRIARMLVPGLYGGKHLKGNDLGDRTKFLRSFVNNSAYQSDLEVGDIILSYGDNITTTKIYLYLGNDSYGPILARFTRTDDGGEPLFLMHTDKYLDTYYQDESLQTATANKPSNQILNELFGKDLFVVLRPSRLGTTVKFNANGGKVPYDDVVVYDKYTEFPEAEKDSAKVEFVYNKNVSSDYDKYYLDEKTFGGWYTDEDFAEQITEESDLLSVESHTLYAKYNEQTFSLPVPEVEGYLFEGWYTDSTLTEEVPDSEEYLIENDHKLYAKWTANQYTVEYSPVDGEGEMDSGSFTYGVAGELATNEFTYEGHVFDGWSTTPEGEVEFLDGQSVINLASDTDSVVTLYAVWREEVADQYSIGVKVNNGTVDSVRKVVNTGTNAVFTINGNTGYGNATVSCTNGSAATISGNTLTVPVTSNDVCTVTYAANSYNIIYDPDGGTGTMDPTTVQYGDSATLRKNTFERPGYEFKGWTLKTAEYIDYLDEGVVKNLTTESSVTLYAVWEIVEYKVTLDLNGGTLGYSSLKYTIEDTSDITLEQPTKKGYTFTGWTGSNGETPELEVTIAAGSTGNKNYVANWEPSKYTVTYASDENGTITGITEEEVAIGGNPSGTTWDIGEGYKHLKWAANKDVTLNNEQVILAGDDLSIDQIKNVVVDSDIVFTTYHYITKYSINYENGENGTISGIVSEDVAKDSTLLGTRVAADDGYEFSHWVADKDVTLSDGTVIASGDAINMEQLSSIVATEELNLTAMFKIRVYIIKYLSDANGSITGVTSEEKLLNETLAGTTTKANENFMFMNWTADKDVTLKDGTIITKGEAISNEQLLEIEVKDDMTFTAVHVREQFVVFYKGTTGITIEGEGKEIVKYGKNPVGVSIKTDSTTRTVIYTIDKDVVLVDDTEISSGKELTLEQLKQVVVTDDLTVTVKYGGDEVINNIPNTGRIQSVISVLGGLLLFVIGISLLYANLNKKRFN